MPRKRERERGGEIARNLAVMGQIYYTSNVINFFRARRLCGLVPSLYGIPQACQTKNGGKPEEGRNVVFREAEAKHLVRTQVVQQSMVARAGSWWLRTRGCRQTQTEPPPVCHRGPDWRKASCTALPQVCVARAFLHFQPLKFCVNAAILGVVWMCWTGNNPMPSAPSQAIPVHVLNVLLGFPRGSPICDLSRPAHLQLCMQTVRRNAGLSGSHRVSPGLTRSNWSQSVSSPDPEILLNQGLWSSSRLRTCLGCGASRILGPTLGWRYYLRLLGWDQESKGKPFPKPILWCVLKIPEVAEYVPDPHPAYPFLHLAHRADYLRCFLRISRRMCESWCFAETRSIIDRLLFATSLRWSIPRRLEPRLKMT